MSEPVDLDRAAILLCIPALQGEPGKTKRIQRFHVVQRVDKKPSYTWVSEHRYAESAFARLADMLEGDRLEARVFDLSTGAFLTTEDLPALKRGEQRDGRGSRIVDRWMGGKS